MTRGDRLAPALILLAVLAAYGNALRSTFQFDDWKVIVYDPRVQSLSAWWAAFPGIRPLLHLSWALCHEAGFASAGFHAVNGTIHAAAAIAAYALLRRLPGSGERGRRHDPAAAAMPTAGGFAQAGGPDASDRLAAFFGAALFAVHPVQTEAVTYACGGSSSLSGLFVLASLVCWLAGLERGRAWLVHGLSPLLFGCALAVKETAAVLPLALALLWALARPEAARAPARSQVRAFLTATAGHWIVLAVAAALALSSRAYRHLLAVCLQTRGTGENLRTQAHAVWWLAGQLVRFDRLNADPMLPVIPAWTVPVALEGAALVGLIALGFASVRRRGALAFGLLWFFLWLAPTNSLLPRLDVANDRQLYLALLGPAWVLASSVMRLERRAGWAASLASRGALVALCVWCGVAVVQRNAVYRDEIVFWRDVVAKAPHNARAFTNLGYALALACRNDEADSVFVHSLQIDPTDVRTAVNLRLLRMGKLFADPPPCAGAGAGSRANPVPPRTPSEPSR